MKLARRHVLRGAGLALALPFLGSLEPRRARGQAVRARRFVPIFFPLGAGAYWRPATTGEGAALSPILEPFAPVKSKVTVLSHVDATAYGPLPAAGNSLLTGSFLTCTPGLDNPVTNGISIDQRIASSLAGKVPLGSLQVGLSTMEPFAEDVSPSFGRSISWSSPTAPMYKIISPQAVFDRLVGAAGGLPTPESDAASQARAARKSVLDYVLGNASSLKPRLGQEDGQRLDQFLTSIRDVEKRVAAAPMAVPGGGSCRAVPTRPSLAVSVGNVPADYDRATHASLMIDLVVMALSCDITRVVSFMLDDARSDFSYSFLTERKFTSTGSTPGVAKLSGLHAMSMNGDLNDAWATADWWFASKVSELCQKLDALPDGDGQTVLDNSVVWFGSGQHDGGESSRDLRALYVGSGGGVLRTNWHVDLAPGVPLSNVYLTFLRDVFGVNDATFADSTGRVPQILA